MLNRGTRGAQGGVEMSIEIDVLNGDASWPMAEPLFNAVWPPQVGEKLPWADIVLAHAELRVLIEAEPGGVLPATSASIAARSTGTGARSEHRRHRRRSTREDCRRHGYASIALNAAIQTLRKHEALPISRCCSASRTISRFTSRGWQPFDGEIYAEQPAGPSSLRGDGALRLRFQARAAAGRHRPMRSALVTMHGRGLAQVQPAS